MRVRQLLELSSFTFVNFFFLLRSEFIFNYFESSSLANFFYSFESGFASRLWSAAGAGNRSLDLR